MSMCLYHHLAIYGSLSQRLLWRFRREAVQKKKHSKTVMLLSRGIRRKKDGGSRSLAGAWLGGGAVSLEKPKKKNWKVKGAVACWCRAASSAPRNLSHQALSVPFPPFPFAVPFELPTESFFLLSSHEELQTRTNHLSASLSTPSLLS